MVTISLEWQGTPYVNALFIGMNAYLLIYDYHKLKFIISDHSTDIKAIKSVRSDRTGDLLWALAFVLILLSIPLSYIHLIAAWILVGNSMLLIAYIQIFRKKHITR